MNRIFSCVLCFLLCISMCFSAFSEQNIAAVSDENGNFVIRVEGDTDPALGGKSVNILMRKKGESVNEISQLAHIGYTTVDSSGHYSYKFSYSGNLSEYEVLTKIADNEIQSGEISIMNEKRLSIELNLLNKDRTAFSLSDTSQYELKAFVDNKLGTGKRVDLISAFYNGKGSLIHVASKPNCEIPTSFDGVLKIEGLFEEIPDETARIELMVWENGTMKPLGNASEYNFDKTDFKEFYISADGNDLYDGSFDRPFKTLIGARNAVRDYIAAKGLPQNGITVYIKGGTYPITQTVDFNEKDSGTKESPIVYKAVNGEKVIFSGGVHINGGDFSRVTDNNILQKLPADAQRNVYCVNLKNYGITDYGQRNVLGALQSNPIPGIEAFCNDKPMVTARYPNVDSNGKQQYIYTGKSGKDDADGLPLFNYTDNFIEKASNLGELVIEGWFPTSYEYFGCGVKKLDKDTKTIYLSETTEYGVRENNRYCISNMLEALDAENEYYIDKKTGMLYVYCADINNADISLSVFGDTPSETFIRMTDASNITFSGFDIELCKSSGISVYGGENVTVSDCVIKNMGIRGAIIGSDGDARVIKSVNGLNANADGFYNKDFKRAFNHAVVNCEIYNTGYGAITVAGGDRKNLVPSNHRIENCKIHDVGRFRKTFPMAGIYGVGITVSNCDFYNSPFAAITFGGNDIIIKYNEFSNVINDCSDQGAIYSCTYSAALQAGSEIFCNYFHDIPNKPYDKGDIYAENTTMRVAVYNDFCDPFLEVYNNCFENVPIGIYNSGGAENNWRNNLFINVNKPMIISANNFISNAFNNSSDGRTAEEKMFDTLSTREYVMFNVASGAWKEKYPKVSEVKSQMLARGAEAAYPSSTVENNTCIFLNEESRNVLSYLQRSPEYESDGETMKLLEYESEGNTHFFGFLDKITDVRHFRKKDQNKYLTIENNIYTTEDIVSECYLKYGIDFSKIGSFK